MSLEVRKVPRMGRGVFATKSFKEGDVIEVCHVILFDHSVDSKKQSATAGYSFQWNKKQVAISLGNGSLYNHSSDANAYVTQQLRDKTMTITAHKPIKVGEQVFINYMGEPDCQDEVWF